MAQAKKESFKAAPHAGRSEPEGTGALGLISFHALFTAPGAAPSRPPLQLVRPVLDDDDLLLPRDPSSEDETPSVGHWVVGPEQSG